MNSSMQRETSEVAAAGRASITGQKKRRLADHYMQSKTPVDYRDVETLRRFISPEGKVLPSRRTGLCSVNQRKVTRAIKRARVLGLLPFATSEF